uniref:Uncharacterized protein n=1 Tax=Anopheles coluzzii TaxID=1518534 RepID=A0A8W7PJC8_ANOCL
LISCEVFAEHGAQKRLLGRSEADSCTDTPVASSAEVPVLTRHGNVALGAVLRQARAADQVPQGWPVPGGGQPYGGRCSRQHSRSSARTVRVVGRGDRGMAAAGTLPQETDR